MKSQRLVLLPAFLILVAGVAVSVFHYYAGEPGGPDGWMPSAGFGAPFVGAGVLTLVGVHRSWPELVFVAVLALGPMSIVSIALFPFLILGAAALTLLFSDQKSLDPLALVAPAILALALVGVFFLGIYVEDLLPWISIGIVGGAVLIGLVWPAVDKDVVGLKRV